MRVEFLSPEAAAQRIRLRCMERGLPWRASRRQVGYILGVAVGRASLERWVRDPARYEQLLQLLWWAVENSDALPSIDETHAFIGRASPAGLCRLLAGHYSLQSQRIARWKKRLPDLGVWEAQAVVLLANALLQETVHADS